jgi:DNA-3-methyladenine glycosylase II
MTETTQREILAHLGHDPRLQPLLASLPFPPLQTSSDIYLSLLESVVSQQLSVKVADAIWLRFLALFPGQYPTPELLLAEPAERLRGAGLSGAKTGYLRSVAEFSLAKGLDHAQLSPLPDQELIDYLTQIKGVGKWTAELQLLFALGRPDVFPVDDLIIRQMMIKLYDVTETGKQAYQRLAEIAENWRPYRSWACRYLWNGKGLLREGK